MIQVAAVPTREAAAVITKVLALLLLSCAARAQTGIFMGPTSSCNFWARNPDSITEWITVDTLGAAPGEWTAPDWVYRKEEFIQPLGYLMGFITILPNYNNYDPKPATDVYITWRVDRNSSIRQTRKRIVDWHWVACPQAEYDRICDSLAGLKPIRTTAYYPITVDTVGAITSWTISRHLSDSVSSHILSYPNPKIWMKRKDCPCKTTKTKK